MLISLSPVKTATFKISANYRGTNGATTVSTLLVFHCNETSLAA